MESRLLLSELSLRTKYKKLLQGRPVPSLSPFESAKTRITSKNEYSDVCCCPSLVISNLNRHSTCIEYQYQQFPVLLKYHNNPYFAPMFFGDSIRFEYLTESNRIKRHCGECNL